MLNLKLRIEYLKDLIKEKELALKKAPKGSVHVSVIGNKVRYYHKTEKGRKYIKKKEEHKIQILCQKDYDKKVFQCAQKELVQLERLQQEVPKLACEEVFESLHVAKKKYVNPIVLPDDLFAEKWLAQEFQGKSLGNIDSEYYTVRKEHVRSKTEILIADALLRHNIPYRYECPLYLEGMGTVYPDFTVLNVRLRKEMYWEHMGMMDNAEYAQKALNKIIAYEKNDIFPGDKLILTHETLQYAVQPAIIESTINKYLK